MKIQHKWLPKMPTAKMLESVEVNIVKHLFVHDRVKNDEHSYV